MPSNFNNLPTVNAVCQRRSPEIQAGIQSNTVNTGQENELMVVRACLEEERADSVAIRFEGYGVEVGATARAYMQALFALPAMREWREAAAAETESVAATDAVRAPR